MFEPLTQIFTKKYAHALLEKERVRKEKAKKGLGPRTLLFIFSIMRGHILFLIIKSGIFSDDPSFLPYVYKFPNEIAKKKYAHALSQKERVKKKDKK